MRWDEAVAAALDRVFAPAANPWRQLGTARNRGRVVHRGCDAAMPDRAIAEIAEITAPPGGPT